jgi:chromosomal replication initiator protein
MSDRSAQEIWEVALGELQVQVSKPNYRTWLEKTVGLSHQDNQFVIGVPNTFIAEYLSKNQRCLIEKTLIGLTHHDVDIVFQVNGREPSQPTNHSSQERVPATKQISSLRFNSKYTFDSFVVGSCNRLAHAAAREVAASPGHSYNPLFIYGGVGLGKTHLLQAIGQEAIASNLQVIYVSAERFTSEFITSLQERQTEEFNHKYRSVDLLLIDDIQFIAGKEQTQEIFFHTFNELHNSNRQIAVTSNSLPQTISSLENRLRSRLEWGLIVDIQPPAFETRLAILQAKAEREGANVASEVLEFLAQQIQQNIRELEGYLNRAIALARLTRALLTPELAAQALKNIADKESAWNSVTPDQVIAAVTDSFQLAPLDLKSRKRDKETALARQMAIYLIKQETNCSLTRIGQELGGRNHSTITHAYEKVADEINTNPYLQRKLSEIQQSLHHQPRKRNNKLP